MGSRNIGSSVHDIGCTYRRGFARNKNELKDSNVSFIMWLRVKTGYCALNSNTYVADAVIRSLPNCATEYGCALTSTG